MLYQSRMKTLNTAKKFKFAKRFILILCILLVQQVAKAGTLKIDVTGLKNDKGFVQLVIYNNAKNFPKDGKYYKLYKLKITGKKSILTVKNMPPGTYAIALMHDENSNKKMDKNMVGIPKEGFGFSNNPRVVFKEPTYNECKFDIGGNGKAVSIKLIYF